MDELAIRVDNVSKTFKLPHEKQSSVKSVFVNLLNPKKGYELQEALKDVSFEVKKGEFFGIVGRNGSGKSTLLKIIAGIYQPTAGTVGVNGKLVPFIELGVGFNSELTGRENVYLNGALLGFSNKEVDKMYKDIVKFAELSRFMDQKLKNYSSGMQVRLAFSMAIKAEADILLIDEVLAVGDADFQRKCFSYFRSLKKNKKTVIFVSHDMDAVREYCDRAIMIENSEVLIEGDTSKVAAEYLKLFEKSKPRDFGSGSNRTGNDLAKFDMVTCHPASLSNQPSVKIECKISASQNINNSVVGFFVKNESGTWLLGSNNKLEDRIIDLVKTRAKTVEWEIPNIFSQGRYYVGVAIQTEEQIVCDWWDDATSFEVTKKAHTGYLINPSLNLRVN